MASQSPKRSPSESSNVADQSPTGGFLFVQYPSDARLGRKHLQSKSMKEHLSRRRRIQKIHKFRNVNVPVAPSTSENEPQIPDSTPPRSASNTVSRSPSAPAAAQGQNPISDRQRSEEAAHELWEALEWDRHHTDGETQDPMSQNGSAILSPASHRSSTASTLFDGMVTYRPKTPPLSTSTESQFDPGGVDLWGTGWTSVASFTTKLPVRLDARGWNILQHHFRMPEISYQLKGESPLIIHRDAAFPLACRSEASWYAMISTASAHRDALMGRGKSPVTLEYEAQALKGVRDAINDPKERYAPNTYGLVLCTANAARMLGLQDVFKAHCLGMSQIWKNMGGPASLMDWPDLNLIACAVGLVLSKSQIQALDELHIEGRLPDTYLHEVHNSLQDLIRLVASFVRAQKPAASGDGNPLDMIFTFCRRSSWLHPIVSPSEDVISVSKGALKARERDGQRANDIFILLNFCDIILKYRNEARKCLSLLSLLGQRLKASTGTAGTNKYVVVWHLISGVGEGPNMRTWEIFEMVKAMHRFNLNSQNRMLQALSAPFLSAYMASEEILNDNGLEGLQKEAVEIMHDLGIEDTFDLASPEPPMQPTYPLSDDPLS